MNINEIYELIRFVSNKAQSGSFTPEQFNLAVNSAQLSLFMERYNNPAEYQPGQPIPRVAYEMTQKISDDLRVFKKLIDLTLDSNGQGTLPPDYIHATSMRFNYIIQKKKVITQIERSIDVVDDDKLGDRLSSNLVMPTKRYPIATFYDTYIQFNPKDLRIVKFTYLRQPLDAIWAFTTVNDRPVYDPVNSVDLEWHPLTHNEIIVRTLSLVGINLREEQLLQYAEMKKSQGI